MKKEISVVLICILLYAMAWAQCAPTDSLQRAVIIKRMDEKLTYAAKLETLLACRKDIMQRRSSNDTLYAWLLYRIGLVYFDLKAFPEASSYFLQSINLTKAAVNQHLTGPDVLLKKYYWLSAVYDSLNNTIEKRKVIDSCIIVSERLKIPGDISAIRCLNERLQYFYDIGEYGLCVNDAVLCGQRVDIYLKNTRIATDVMAGDGIKQNSFHWHINALLALQRYADVEKLLIVKAAQYKRSGSADLLALTYAQLGDLNEKNGNYDQSLLNFNAALRIYRKNKSFFNCKQELNNIGEKIYFHHLNDYDKALACFRAALACINHDKSFVKEDSIESANIYRNIADVYVEKKMFDSARFYFLIAFNHIRKEADELNILTSTMEEFSRYKKIDYFFDLLIDYGNANLKQYQAEGRYEVLDNAIRIYTQVDKLGARINISQFESDSKLLWRKISRRLYENAIEACYLRGNTEKAFYFFERSRAALLNIQLSERNWMNNKDVTARARLQKKKVALTKAIDNETEDSPAWKSLQDSLRTMNEDLYSLLQNIRFHHPLYYQNMDTSSITIQNVLDKSLKDGQAMLEFFSGSQFIYSLMITARHASINKIVRGDFEAAAKSYNTYLSDHNLLNKDFNGFRKAAYYLYTLIFGNRPLPEKRLIVSPDGAYLPLESLIADNTLTDPVYLIADHAISYTYSARYLQHNFVLATAGRSENFMGVAPVNFSPRLKLSSLGGSSGSLHKIGEYFFGSRLLTGSGTTKANFGQQFSEYKIIQLYTHASDSSEHGEPVIYFADSALYLSEIIPEKNPATQLIVLSACETGNGVDYKGEGVFSFNRAFAALGIPSSVSNLWSIDNVSTYKLTELFYKYLSEGLPLDIALQKAKLEYIKNADGENILPYYWAAPIVVGKTDPIILYWSFAWRYLFAGIGFAVLVFFWLKKIKRKKWINQVPDTVQTAP